MTSRIPARSGALCAALLAFLAGGVLGPLASGTPQAAHNWPLTVRILGVPTPSEYVRIPQAQPYTVPAGKTLVVTAVGVVEGIDSDPYAEVVVNGARVIRVRAGRAGAELPYPITASPGDVVEVACTSTFWGTCATTGVTTPTDMVLLGYLAEG